MIALPFLCGARWQSAASGSRAIHGFQVSFGIGTNLTNDMGQTPLNIVLKLVECNGQSVAKISDSPGKTMTDNDTFLAYLRQVFEIAEAEVN